MIARPSEWLLEIYFLLFWTRVYNNQLNLEEPAEGFADIFCFFLHTDQLVSVLIFMLAILCYGILGGNVCS